MPVRQRSVAEVEAWYAEHLPQALPELHPPRRRHRRTGRMTPTAQAKHRRRRLLDVVACMSAERLNPREVAGRLWFRVCPVCGEDKRWSEWHLWAATTGLWRTKGGRCRTCYAARSRELHLERSMYPIWRQRKRRYMRALEARYMADPVLRERRRRQKRESARRRARRNKRFARPMGGKAAGEQLPIGPFRAWLLKRLPVYAARNDESLTTERQLTGVGLMADVMGISPRQLETILHDEQKQHVRMDTVDRATVADGTARLDDLYPFEEPTPHYFRKAA